jgi:hypothetical protein
MAATQASGADHHRAAVAALDQLAELVAARDALNTQIRDAMAAAKETPGVTVDQIAKTVRKSRRQVYNLLS